MLDQCPDCKVDLEDDGCAVRCWRCGWEVRAVDDPRGYRDLADEIADREEFLRHVRRR